MQCGNLKTALLFVGLTILQCAVIPVSADAHSLYVQGTRYHVADGKSSPFFFCYGHHIPVDDAIRRKKLHTVKVHAPDGTQYNVQLRNEKSLHSYLVEYNQAGTYAITAETTPGFFTKWIDKKGRTRHAIKPMSAVADKASQIVSSTRSSQWAKTYVECKNPSPKFPAFLGLPLELVPDRNPALLKKGESVQFTVFLNGKPYTGDGFWDATYNGYSTQAEDYYFQRSHIKNGRFNFPIEHTGRWFVRFFLKIPAPQGEQGKYFHKKLTTTLVFEIPNERRKAKIDSH